MPLLVESWLSMATETKKTPQGTFHDAVTGETIVRDLTAEEIASAEENYPSDFILPSAE